MRSLWVVVKSLCSRCRGIDHSIPLVVGCSGS